MGDKWGIINSPKMREKGLTYKGNQNPIIVRQPGWERCSCPSRVAKDSEKLNGQRGGGGGIQKGRAPIPDLGVE